MFSGRLWKVLVGFCEKIFLPFGKIIRVVKAPLIDISREFANEDKTVVDKEGSRWEIYAGNEKILQATGAETYEDQLDENWETFASKRYGREVLRAIRTEGLDKVAYLLTGKTLEKTAQPPMPMPPAPAVGEAPAMPAPAAPMPEEGGEAEEGAKDPTGQALDALTESLEGAEKALGDLKDALEETTGETEAELPSTAEADDDEKCEKCEKCKPY